MWLGGRRAPEAMTLAAALCVALSTAACSSTPEPVDRPLDADPPGPVDVEGKGPKRPAGLDEGVELVKSGKFADAIPVLKKALDEEPRSAESAFYLGLAIEQSGGDKKEAEKLYKQAVAFDATLVEAANNLAAIYLDEPPRPDQAIPVIKKALAHDPENVNLLTNLGYAYGLKGDIDSASKAYDQALAKSPSAQLSFAYGTMLFENKRVEQAVPHLVKAADGIDDAPTLATIGRMLGPGKAFAECVKVLDKAIGLKKDAAEFFVRRGICKHELDQEKDAGADFESAIKIDPNFQAAHYYLAQSLFAQGNGIRAKQELKRAYDLGKDTPIGKQAKDMLDGKKKPPPKGGAPKKP